MNVLVVSDVLPLTKQLVSIIETLTGGAIITAGHRNNAFGRFCEFRPDLVVADADMVAMNAIDLVRDIRHDPGSPDRKTPVILLTAQTMAARIERARDAGVTGLVTKPFSANDLTKRITRVLTDPRAFIDGPAYVGPDRRRKIQSTYAGPLRRAADQKTRR